MWEMMWKAIIGIAVLTAVPCWLYGMYDIACCFVNMLKGKGFRHDDKD